jgi:hypothetical protein
MMLYQQYQLLRGRFKSSWATLMLRRTLAQMPVIDGVEVIAQNFFEPQVVKSILEIR